MNTNINQIIEKYWQGDTTLQEEQEIRDYFQSGNIAEEHKAVAPMFGLFTQQRAESFDIDLSSALRSKLEGEAATDTEPVSTGSAKVVNLRKMIYAVAAVFAIVLTATIIMNQDSNDIISETTPQYASNVIVLDGEDDSEEALQMTKEALAFLSGKLSKSGKEVNAGVQKLDKFNVIN